MTSGLKRLWRVIVCGHYTDIFILDAATLEVSQHSTYNNKFFTQCQLGIYNNQPINYYVYPLYNIRKIALFDHLSNKIIIMTVSVMTYR